MNWIKHPLELEGKKIRLIPLENSHLPALLKTGANPAIWEFMAIKGWEPDVLTQHLKSAILKRAVGEQYPFTVVDKVTGAFIGSTMMHNMSQQHKKLEIGWTWYDPAYWRTGTNRECKYLLLRHAFEVLGTNRVQFQAWDQNLRSRAAIEGIGAQFEGLLRYDRIRFNGQLRDTAMYSIIAPEWPAIRARLELQLG